MVTEAATYYMQVRTGKDNIRSWRSVVGGEDPRFGRYGIKNIETGFHIAFHCSGSVVGRVWGTW